MIVGSIEFEHQQLQYAFPFEAPTNTFTLNDAYFRALFETHQLPLEGLNPSSLSVVISAERDTVVVEDLYLFNHICISSFNNSKASFGLLVINGIKAEIRSAFIDILRTECDWIHISRSLIRSFEFSLNAAEAYRDEGIALETADLLELNYVTVEKLNIYKSVKELILKSAKIDLLEIDEIVKNNFDFINITWNTFIEEFSIAGNIGRLRIKNSIINKLNFKNTFIQLVDNKKSDLHMVYMLDLDKIKTKNDSAWGLLYKSAIHDDNDALYARAGFEINHLRHKDQTGFNRVGGSILRYTIGYGYRPYRAIAFSIIAISLFALVYMILELIGTSSLQSLFDFPKLVAHYFDMWYLSGTAYTTTGFGDIVPHNGATKILVIFEAMVGVSVLSLFMYSLLNRYSNKQ